METLEKETGKEEKTKKNQQEKYEKLYYTIMNYEEELHLKNQKRVKKGIVCLFVIPLVFLVLMFLTDSSKPIFLALWIISLYGIAIFLIGVEYADYKLQEKLAAFKEEDHDVNQLLELETKNIELAIQTMKENMEKTMHSEKEVEKKHE